MSGFLSLMLLLFLFHDETTNNFPNKNKKKIDFHVAFQIAKHTHVHCRDNVKHLFAGILIVLRGEVLWNHIIQIKDMFPQSPPKCLSLAGRQVESESDIQSLTN